MIKQINTVDAGENKQGARLNAFFTSRSNRARFTAAEQARAETFADVVRLAYAGEVIVNFRKTMATIKVMNKLIRDKRAAETLLQICKERGYKMRVSEQGINFNLQKA